jgi:hypothetical protein
MSEAVQKGIESGKDSRLTTHDSRLTGFEPDILAFCCEH